MARLDITSPSGKVRETALPPGQPLTVGRHASSDIRVNAEGVEQVHLRLTPLGDGGEGGYKMTAGFPNGVRVNGSAVAEKVLADGDLMQVGPATFVFRADAPADDGAGRNGAGRNGAGRNGAAKPAGGGGSMELVAMSSDALPTWADKDRAKAAAARDGAKRDGRSSGKNGKIPGEDGEARAKAEAKRTRRNEPAVPPPAAGPAADDGPGVDGPDADEPGGEDDGSGLDALAALAHDETGEVPDLGPSAGEDAGAGAPADGGEQPVLLGPPGGGRFAPLTKLAGKPRRPGEQSILKSPLVVGLASTAAVLTIAAFAIALLTNRERAARLYDAATEARTGGRYTEAVGLFDEFLDEYPADSLTATVRTDRGLTLIERAVAGSGGEWAEGVTAIENFVRDNRDLETFEQSTPALAALARRTALGAAAAAAAGGPRDLLGTVEEAAALHRRYADPEAASTIDRTAEIAGALKGATAAVVKRETFGGARDAVAAALGTGDFAAAHRAREDLIARYRDLADDRDVRKLKADTLAAEAAAVTAIPAGEAPPRPAPRPGALVPAFVSRAGTGEKSDGRTILTRGGPAVFAVDAVTGLPAWRAGVGSGAAAAFEPVEADAAGSAVLVCDSLVPALVSLDRTTGAVRWRLPLPAAATGPPRAAGGRALLGCGDGSLLAVDPETGRVTGGLKFPQAVLSPPAPVGGPDGDGTLLLAGARDTVYTLAGSPPALVAVSYTGHGPGAVAVPPRALGALVMLCDNDRPDAALLRAFRLADDGTVGPAGAARVAGTVDVPPELRGDRLFVSSSPERMTAFAVSDAGDRDVFSRLAAAQIPDARRAPTHLAAGPDGLLWAAGTALRQLRLTSDGLRLGSAVLAAGRHTEPPVTSGDRLFTTRLNPSGTATLFAAARAEEMTGLSRTVLAPDLLAVAGADSGRPTLVYAGGVTVPARPLPAAGGTAVLDDGRTLPGLDEDEPARVLARANADGSATVAVGGSDPRVWSVDASGRAGRPDPLPGEPQLAPLPLGPGVLAPLAGRLELVTGRGGRPVAPYTAPVTEGDPPAWTAAVKLSADRAAVVDAAGAVRLIEYRAAPAPNLAEVAAASPGWFADVPPAAAPGPDGAPAGLAAAGSDGALHLLNAATLGELAAAPLPGRAAFGPAVVAGRVLVSVADRTGATFAVAGFAAADLAAPAVTPLPAPAAGPPAALGDAAAVATTGGAVVRFDPATGAVTGVAETGQPLSGALLTLSGEPAAVTADGAVVRLTFAPPGTGDSPPGTGEPAVARASGDSR